MFVRFFSLGFPLFTSINANNYLSRAAECDNSNQFRFEHARKGAATIAELGAAKCRPIRIFAFELSAPFAVLSERKETVIAKWIEWPTGMSERRQNMRIEQIWSQKLCTIAVTMSMIGLEHSLTGSRSAPLCLSRLCSPNVPVVDIYAAVDAAPQHEKTDTGTMETKQMFLLCIFGAIFIDLATQAKALNLRSNTTLQREHRKK